MAENRGGARPGAGRPRKDAAEKERKSLLRTLNKYAKRSGFKDWKEPLAKDYFDPKVKAHTRATLGKLLVGVLIGNQEHKDIDMETKQSGPVILPDLYELAEEEEPERLPN